MNILQTDSELNFIDLIHYPEICIEEGKFTFIAGKSGCGKSTYLKIINRTIIPKQGDIIFEQKNVSEINVLQYRRKVLLVPQEVFLFDGTIKDNFDLYYEAREQSHLSNEQIQKFLHICDADFELSSDCKTLSGGERQRVFLAIYLSTKPQVLLLDEPTASLDEKTSITLFQNLKEYCKEQDISVVCVCHNDSMIEKFADNVIRLGDK